MRMTILKGLNYLFLEPAYGRTYKNKEEALQDWKQGKDFKIQDGPYCSIRDREVIANDFHDPTVVIEYTRNKYIAV